MTVNSGPIRIPYQAELVGGDRYISKPWLKYLQENAQLIQGAATQTITLSGDVTGSGTGAIVTTIAAGAVTLSKMADMTTSSFLGRNTVGTGSPEVLSVATAKTLLNLAGTNTGDQTITLSGGDVTTGAMTSGSYVATIGANKVTLAQMAQMATSSFLGRSTASTGNVEVLSTSTARGVLGLATSDSPTFAGLTLSGMAGVGTRMVVSDATGGLSTQSIPVPITLANPTGTIGLTAVNGVATTGIRSDAAPALSQAIAPTWTALHTFSGGIFLSGGTGAAGRIYATATDGTVIWGNNGSSNDFLLTNSAGSSVLAVAHNTIQARFLGDVAIDANLSIAGNTFATGSGGGYWINSSGTFTYGMYKSGTSLAFRSGSGSDFLTVNSSGVPTFANAVNVTGLLTAHQGVAFAGASGTGRISYDATNGILLRADSGSSYDFVLADTTGADPLIRNPHNTLGLEFPGSGTYAFTGPVSMASPLNIGTHADSIALNILGTISGLTGTNQYGLAAQPNFGTGATNSGNAAYIQLRTSGAYTMANGYGLHIDSPSNPSATITAAYGLKIEDQAAGFGVNYAIYTGAGDVRFGGRLYQIGNAEFNGGLIFTGGESSYFGVPQRTTDPSSPEYGYLYWNTSSSHLMLYTADAGGSWVELY